MKQFIIRLLIKTWLVLKLVCPLAFKFWIRKFKEEWYKVNGGL